MKKHIEPAGLFVTKLKNHNLIYCHRLGSIILHEDGSLSVTGTIN